jgi:hypothetical protein
VGRGFSSAVQGSHRHAGRVWGGWTYVLPVEGFKNLHTDSGISGVEHMKSEEI